MILEGNNILTPPFKQHENVQRLFIPPKLFRQRVHIFLLFEVFILLFSKHFSHTNKKQTLLFLEFKGYWLRNVLINININKNQMTIKIKSNKQTSHLDSSFRLRNVLSNPQNNYCLYLLFFVKFCFRKFVALSKMKKPYVRLINLHNQGIFSVFLSLFLSFSSPSIQLELPMVFIGFFQGF